MTLDGQITGRHRWDRGRQRSGKFRSAVPDGRRLAERRGQRPKPRDSPGPGLTLPTAVDGVCDGTAFDYYKFTAKKDQRVSVEVVAARMASTLDPVLRLLDATGKELLLVDDDASFGADCRFAIDDARGRRIRAWNFATISFAAGVDIDCESVTSRSFPPPIRSVVGFGSTMRFRFSGPLADTAAPVFLRLPDDGPSGRQTIGAKIPNGQSSGMATIVTSRLADIVESEPNNDLKIATLTSLPCAVNGTFQEAHDRDYYQFAATKGTGDAVSRGFAEPGLAQLSDPASC